jgi:hypothetical protein
MSPTRKFMPPKPPSVPDTVLRVLLSIRHSILSDVRDSTYPFHWLGTQFWVLSVSAMLPWLLLAAVNLPVT